MSQLNSIQKTITSKSHSREKHAAGRESQQCRHGERDVQDNLQWKHLKRNYVKTLSYVSPWGWTTQSSVDSDCSSCFLLWGKGVSRQDCKLPAVRTDFLNWATFQFHLDLIPTYTYLKVTLQHTWKPPCNTLPYFWLTITYLAYIITEVPSYIQLRTLIQGVWLLSNQSKKNKVMSLVFLQTGRVYGFPKNISFVNLLCNFSTYMVIIHLTSMRSE